MKQRLILTTEQVRRRAVTIIEALPMETVWEVEIREHKTTRSSEQNRRMWATLADIADQVIWHGLWLTKENWKDVFTASLKRLKVVPGIDGGFVVVGAHTSKMSVSEMSEMIECATAFGCQHDVKWRDYE